MKGESEVLRVFNVERTGSRIEMMMCSLYSRGLDVDRSLVERGIPTKWTNLILLFTQVLARSWRTSERFSRPFILCSVCFPLEVVWGVTKFVMSRLLEVEMLLEQTLSFATRMWDLQCVEEDGICSHRITPHHWDLYFRKGNVTERAINCYQLVV